MPEHEADQSHDVDASTTPAGDLALAYLEQVLTAAITSQGATKIVVEDDEGVETFEITPDGIAKAAALASQIDGILLYVVGNASFAVLYDGPYDQANAREIVMDANAEGDRLQQTFNQETGQ